MTTPAPVKDYFVQVGMVDDAAGVSVPYFLELRAPKTSEIYDKIGADLGFVNEPPEECVVTQGASQFLRQGQLQRLVIYGYNKPKGKGKTWRVFVRTSLVDEVLKKYNGKSTVTVDEYKIKKCYTPRKVTYS